MPAEAVSLEPGWNRLCTATPFASPEDRDPGLIGTTRRDRLTSGSRGFSDKIDVISYAVGKNKNHENGS
jgi:hypothetical protein